eukprot:gene2772-1757_t
MINNPLQLGIQPSAAYQTTVNTKRSQGGHTYTRHQQRKLTLTHSAPGIKTIMVTLQTQPTIVKSANYHADHKHNPSTTKYLKHPPKPRIKVSHQSQQLYQQFAIFTNQIFIYNTQAAQEITHQATQSNL